MKPTTFLLSLLLTGVTLLPSCTKPDKPCCTCAVPYTETGANTMGCLMDGKPWAMCDVAGRKINSSANATMDQSLGFNIMSVRNNKFFNGGRQSLILNIHLPKLGIISSSNPRLFFLYGEFSTKVNNDPKGIFAIDTSQYARLEITHFDTIQRIISGKFECTLKRSGSIIDTTTIKVTDGVFDAKF